MGERAYIKQRTSDVPVRIQKRGRKKSSEERPVRVRHDGNNSPRGARMKVVKRNNAPAAVSMANRGTRWLSNIETSGMVSPRAIENRRTDNMRVGANE